MKKLALVAMLTLVGCPEASNQAGTYHPELGPVIEAWQEVVGDVPAHCFGEMAEYEYRFVELEQMPCGVDGCTSPDDRAIFVRNGLTAERLELVLTHEWIHALAQCVDGDTNPTHSIDELWSEGSAEESVFEVAMGKLSKAPGSLETAPESPEATECDCEAPSELPATTTVSKERGTLQCVCEEVDEPEYELPATTTVG